MAPYIDPPPHIPLLSPIIELTHHIESSPLVGRQMSASYWFDQKGCIAAYISIIIITIQTMMIITTNIMKIITTKTITTPIMMTITTKNMMIITILTMTIIDTIEYFQSAAPQVEMKCRTLRDPR